MKNYAEGIEDSKTFITHFEETEDKLIIHFGNGTNYPIPKTSENLKKVLNKMKEQIKSCVNTDRKNRLGATLDKRKIYLFAFLCAFGIFLALSSIAFIVDGLSKSLIIGMWCTLLPSAIGTTVTSIRYFPLRSKINDIEKNAYFNKNCEIINEYLKKNQNVLNNSPKKIKKVVQENEAKSLDLNTIHKITYRDLKKLAENIKIEEAFNFDDKPIKLEKKNKPKRDSRN